MRSLWLVSILLLTGCYDKIAVSANAAMTCYYEYGGKTVVIYSGDVDLDGIGLGNFEEYISGEWTLYKTPEERENSSVFCVLEFGQRPQPVAPTGDSDDDHLRSRRKYPGRRARVAN